MIFKICFRHWMSGSAFLIFGIIISFSSGPAAALLQLLSALAIMCYRKCLHHFPVIVGTILAHHFSGSNITCFLQLFCSILSMENPSMMRIPPPTPCMVRIGIPALQSTSISLLMVLLETSNFSANSGAVIISCCSRTEMIPISLSIFISDSLYVL